MKKILAIALTALMLTGMTGCGQNNAPPETPPGTTSPSESGNPSEGNGAATLEDTMAKLLQGVKIDMPAENKEVTEENFSWHFGIDPVPGAKGLASEAMISSIAHSVALLQLPAGADPAKTAAAIEQKIDPRKWICVEAEKTVVKHKGNLILVIMSHQDIAEGIAANFDAL